MSIDVNLLEIAITVLTWAVPIILVLVLLGGGLFTVDQQTVAVVERFGKFQRIAEAGLNVKIPFIERTDEVSLQIQ